LKPDSRLIREAFCTTGHGDDREWIANHQIVGAVHTDISHLWVSRPLRFRLSLDSFEMSTVILTGSNTHGMHGNHCPSLEQRMEVAIIQVLQKHQTVN
jgi:hypothetical protein